MVSGARADDVTDQINEALKAYQNHDTQTAIAALDAAANLMRQARADGLKKLLPPAPPGWSADEAESTAVGVAMLGGGITASRAYHNGDQRVEVQIMADSPVLQGLGALIGSPLAAIGGMKTVVIGGRRMSYTESDHSYMTAGRRQGDREARRECGYAGCDAEELHRRDRFRRDREAGPLKFPLCHRFFIRHVIDADRADHIVQSAIRTLGEMAMRLGMCAAIGSADCDISAGTACGRVIRWRRSAISW